MLNPISFTSNIKYKSPDFQNQKGAEDSPKPDIQASCLEACSNANRAFVDEKPYFDSNKIRKLNIPNFAMVDNKGVRGESLSSRKNRRFLNQIKQYGLQTVIDLRDKYTSKEYSTLCQKAGLSYYNFPIDSSSVSDDVIIKNMPKLFEVLDNGKFYIACAQGLHRTDIALAINYIFNPNENKVPEMRGHFRSQGFKSDDILRRINSLKKKLTKEDLEKLNWDDSFEEKFAERKKHFVEYNRALGELEKKKFSQNA